MKITLVLASALVASALMPAGPAVAADVWTQLPPDLGVLALSCDGADGNGISEFVAGPGETPLGTGSMRLYAGANDETAVTHDVAQLGDVSAWDFWVNPTAGNDAIIVAFVQTTDDTYQLVGPAGGTANSWTQVDAFHQTLQVYNQLGETGEFVSIADWNTLGHGDGPGVIAVFDAPCFLGQSSGSVYLDGWNLSEGGGQPTAYDFEAGAPLTLAIRTSKTTIVKGRSAKVSTTARIGTDPVTYRVVDLFAKPKGATKFTRVGTATTGSTGVGSLVVQPRRTTTYQWRYAGHKSLSKTVKVTSG